MEFASKIVTRFVWPVEVDNRRDAEQDGGFGSVILLSARVDQRHQADLPVVAPPGPKIVYPR